MMYIFQSLPKFYNLGLLTIYNLIIHLTLSPQSLNPRLSRIQIIRVLPYKMRLDKIMDLTICNFGGDIIGVIGFTKYW